MFANLNDKFTHHIILMITFGGLFEAIARDSKLFILGAMIGLFVSMYTLSDLKINKEK